MTEDGLPIHSFNTLIAELGTRCRHRCRLKSDPQTPSIYQDTVPTPLQAQRCTEHLTDTSGRFVGLGLSEVVIKG